MKIRLLTLLISAIMIAETVIPVYAQEELIVDIVEDIEYEEEITDKDTYADSIEEAADTANVDSIKYTVSESGMSGALEDVNVADDTSQMVDYSDENMLGASNNYTALDTGKCGTNVSYVVYDTDGDNLSDYMVISGTGNMYDTAMPWAGSPSNPNNKIRTVTIEYGVTHVGNRAFEYCTALKSVKLSDSITSIGSYAFNGCRSLADITIPVDVTNISIHMFSGCSALKNVVFYGNVSSIGSEAFSGCTALEELTLPDSLTTIGASAFFFCSKLKKIIIPNNVTFVGDHAFSGCSQLSEVSLPDKLTCVESGLFNECSSLKSIIIPSNVERIKNNAFTGCSSLLEVTIGESMRYIEKYAFYNCTRLTSISIPAGVSAIGDMAIGYYYNSATRTYKITDGFIIYGYDDTAAQTYAINNSITYKGLKLPGTVTDSGKCGDYAYYSIYDTNGDKKGDYLEISGSGYMYERSSWPFNGSYDINNSSIVRIKINNGISGISKSAFQYCTALTTIELPSTIDEIGAAAFLHCTSLTEITIPNGIDELSDMLFKECSSLKHFEIPSSVTKVGINTFSDCISLEKVSIPTSVTYIDYGAFESCKSLSLVNIPDSVSYLGADVFYDCTLLASVNIPVGVTNVSEGLFYNCSKLKKVTIPEGVTAIEPEAFSLCTELSWVTMPESLKIISQDAFNNCTQLKDIRIPSGVNTIGSWAFHNCPKITSMIIPESVTNIGSSAIGYDVYDHVVEGYIIYGITGSMAHKYAKNNNIEFRPLTDDGDVCVPVSDGQCGERAYYTLYDTDDDLAADYLEIYGSGDVYDYEYPYANGYNPNGNNYKAPPWSISTLKKVKIYDGITRVGDYNFYDCRRLLKMNLPDSILSIGKGAFQQCFVMEDIEIPSKLTRISENAFNACQGFTYINIPKGVKEIDDGAFSCCINATSVYIPDSVTTIGEAAFQECTKLEYIDIPDSVTTLGTGVLSYCFELKSVSLPDKLEYINESMFFSCNKLESVKMPENITKIEYNAFGRCKSLKSIYISPNVKQIVDYAVGFDSDNQYIDGHYEEVYTPVADFVIYGVKKSEAEEYAGRMGLKFMAITTYVSKITYELDGGTNSALNPATYNSKNRVYFEEPTKRGYIFEGWYRDAAYHELIEYVDVGDVGDIKIYAKWKLLFRELGYKFSVDGTIKYLVEVSDEILNTGNTYIEFTIGDITTKSVPTVDGNVYEFSCAVPAKQMTDSIKAIMYYGDTSQELRAYSVKAYLDTIINNASTNAEFAKATPLAKAILNYGGYAQEYFGYKTDNLANAGLYEDKSNPVRNMSDKYVKDEINSSISGKYINGDFEYIGASLMCNLSTDINVYFRNKNKLSANAINSQYRITTLGNGTRDHAVYADDDVFRLTILDLPATEIDTVFTISMRGASDNISLSYSPLCYIKKAMDTPDVKLKNLCKALYIYNKEADGYK